MERNTRVKYSAAMTRNGIFLTTCCLVILAGCATTGGSDPAEPVRTTESPGPIVATPPVWPKVAVAYPDSNLLDVTASIGERYDIGVALMQGIGLRPIRGSEHENLRYPSLMESLAREASCRVASTPYYLFLYPPGYESLLQINFYDRVPNAWRDRALSAAFDGNRKLAAVLAFLSDALGKTIIADNLVAEASIGLLRLPYSPVPDVLNAVMQSARVAPQAFDVAATGDYIFIYRRGRDAFSTAHVGAVTPEAETLLSRRVSISLPGGAGAGARFQPMEGAVEFGSVLGSLSRQAGLPVHAPPTLHALPVNQTILRDLPLQTALDLIVRQWPVTTIGYTLRDGAIHFERLP